MPSLLRHPGAVPSLFSSESEPLPLRRPAWRRLAGDARLLALAGWTVVLLVDAPLVRAATAAVGAALRG